MFAAEYELDTSNGRRRAPRVAVDGEVEVDHDGLHRALCKVLSISALGVRIQTYDGLKKGARIWLTLPAIGRIAADVRWADDFTAGCEFRHALGPRQYKALTEALI